MMFTSISIATSVAIGLHFIRKLRRKFSVSEATKGYTWGGPETPGKINVNFKFESTVLNKILNEEFPDHYPIFEGDEYANKELRILFSSTKNDSKAMHGVDVEKLMLNQLEREIRRDIDKAKRIDQSFYANMSKK